MFKATTIILSVGLSVAAGAAGAWERIQTEAQYRERVAGRQITLENGHVTFAADGSAAGAWNGTPMVGSWTWSDGFHCRTLRIGSNDLGTDCQLIELQGNQLRATAQRGQGRVTTARLN